MAPPTTLFPVQEREIYVIKEAVPGTIPATVGVPVPVTSFKPSDKPMWLDDESMQGSMGDMYGVYQGPLIGGWDIGGHITGDVFPHFIYNLLGDYTATGTAASPAGTTNSGVSAGALALPVASGGASFTSGMYVWIEDAGTPAANEVCLVGTGSTSTSVVLAAPGTRFAHLTATPFTNTTFPYVHTFSILNGLIGAANGAAQPPTHTITDRTGIPATGLAAQYAYSCLSELVITADAEKLLDWSAKAICQTRQIAASPVATANVSLVNPYPAWRTTLGVGGTVSGAPVKDFSTFEITLTRAVKAYNTLQGAQIPYVIARGKQSNAGKYSVAPAIDESALIQLLANTQPQVQLIAANGLAGASQVQVQIDILLAAQQTADLADGSELFGYDVPFKVPHTAVSVGGITMTGASGGKGAVKVTITNAVPTY